MAMIFPEDKVCALCGYISSQFEMASSNAFGSADLDTKPPEMMRSTMHTWMQKCPQCGDCYKDITKTMVKSPDAIKAEEYRRQFNNPDFPELANDFLCYSLILVGSMMTNCAAWECVSAAWDCNDNQDQERASYCRNRAVELFQIAKSNDTLSMDQVRAFEALITDLFRRSGRFVETINACKDGLALNRAEILKEVLRFEEKLIQKQDTKCYTIEDVSKF